MQREAKNASILHPPAGEAISLWDQVPVQRMQYVPPGDRDHCSRVDDFQFPGPASPLHIRIGRLRGNLFCRRYEDVCVSVTMAEVQLVHKMCEGWH